MPSAQLTEAENVTLWRVHDALAAVVDKEDVTADVAIQALEMVMDEVVERRDEVKGAVSWELERD